MAIVRLIRGVAAAAQTTPGTAAVLGSDNWLNWATMCKFTDEITVDFPKLLHYQIWMEMQGIPLTRLMQWEIQGLMDTWQWAWFLNSFDGSPSGAGPYVFAPGKNAAKFLTLVKVNANLTTYRRLVDAICSEITMDWTANGLTKFTAKGPAIEVDPVGSAPVPSYNVPGDKSPLQPAWGRWVVNNVARNIVSGKLTLKQTVNPFYASGTGAVPTSPVGVSPTDWEVDDMGATLDIVSAYTADAGSDLANYRDDVTNATNTLTAQDPVTAGTKGLIVTMPKIKAASGDEDDTKAISRQHTVQHLIYDAATVSGLSISVKGDSGFTAT